MTPALLIFGLVYLGMILGGLPFVQLDRTGVALLGAIAMIATEAISVEDAAKSVHLPTLLLLFAFMVVSAQMRLGGFYDWITVRLAGLPVSPPALAATLIAVVAALSAVFSNDVVCLAVAPVLVDACLRRGLDPVPFLLALACGANIGSAATLIGNPQNMLIGQTLGLSFTGYAAEAAVPVLAGLAVTWGLIAMRARGRWQQGDADRSSSDPASASASASASEPAQPGPAAQEEQKVQEAQEAQEAQPKSSQQAQVDEAPRLDRWQTAKGLAVVLAVLLAFLFAPWPREVVALTGAGILLMSRRLHSASMLGLVDWELLILFMGLFVVNAGLQRTGLPMHLVADLEAHGLRLDHPVPLFGAAFVLSNIVSNVPAVMLLLPVARHPLAGPLLALSSTFAGNLFIVGSIANIIVVDAAARRGVRIDWRRHAAVGVPVTLATLAITGLYLWWRMAA